MFPPLFEMADNFPNLKDFGKKMIMKKKNYFSDVHIYSDAGAVFFSTSQPLKPMPSFEIPQIIGDVSAECKAMKATPNVTKLLMQKIMHRSDDPSHINFQSIANYLPTLLQSFGWLICRITHHILLHSLNAAITGFPEELCTKNSEIFRNRDSLSAEELAFYQLKQRNCSILDLKGK